MIRAVTITERGPAPRNLRRLFGNLQKAAWQVTAEAYHEHYRDLRFTEQHGRAAGYSPRKGEGQTGKAFWRSYAGRKRLKFGHSRPLEWSGETRRAVASASITVTRNRADIAYAGARKLNFRHPKSEIRMSEEFTRILPAESADLARRYDRELDRLLKLDASVSHMSLT